MKPFAILAFLTPIISLAQPAAHTIDKDTFETADIMAEFPGGVPASGRFLRDNIQYPKEALRAGIQGLVFLEFVVEKDGSISNVEVYRGLGYGCDKEAIRLIQSMPKWTPASKNGSAIRQRMRFTIRFKR